MEREVIEPNPRQPSPFCWSSIGVSLVSPALIVWHDSQRYAAFTAARSLGVSTLDSLSYPIRDDLLLWVVVVVFLLGTACAFFGLWRQERATGIAVLGLILNLVAPAVASSLSSRFSRSTRCDLATGSRRTRPNYRMQRSARSEIVPFSLDAVARAR